MKRPLILILMLALLATVGCATQAIAPTPSATNVPTPKPTVATPEPTWKPEPTPTEKPTPMPTVEATAVPSFKDMEVTLDNVEAALNGFFLEGEYIGTDVENSGGTIYVTIMYKPLTITNENDFAVQVGHQAARVMEVLFSNPAVNVVIFKGNTATLENALEISMSKEAAETVDWSAMIYRAQTDYKAILDVADYHMDSSISDKLD